MRRENVELPTNPKRDRPSDLWICGRACQSDDASPCVHGPSRSGRCPLGDACRPKLTWAGKKRRVAYFVIAVATVILLVVSRSSIAPTVFKPGELSRPHAQILAGKLTSQRCGSCHEAAATNPLGWMAGGAGDVHSIGQTDRCMECHHATIDRQFATHAHNLADADRRQRTKRIRTASLSESRSSWSAQLTATSLDQNNVQCGVCHREHQGPDGDLLSLSDAQCQTCHSESFGHFADNHPDWHSWPYGRGGRIAFNHATHAGKHFPATLIDGAAQKFDCRSCHPSKTSAGTLNVLATASQSGEIVRSIGYEAACASCHDEALKVQSRSGLELVSLPILPEPVAQKISGWPESATGFYDGTISPLAELLMRGDATTAQSLRDLPDRDFSRLPPRSSRSPQTAAELGNAVQSLLEDLASEGQSEWARRARDAGVTPASVLTISRSLSPQFIGSVYREWFSRVPERRPGTRDAARKFARDNAVRQVVATDEDLLGENLSGSDLLGEDLPGEGLPGEGLLGDDLGGNDLLGGDPLADPLASDPLADPLADPIAMGSEKTPPVKPIAPSDLVADGGWFHDSVRNALSYRSGGHADKVMVSWLETIAQLPDSDPVRIRALKTPAVAACASCHAGALQLGGGWKAETRVGLRSDFTKFSHRPHLNVSTLGDCQHCHQVAPASTAAETLVAADDSAEPPTNEKGASRWHSHPIGDFLPLGKESCAACHLPTAAGDNCVTCHRYHIDHR